MFKQLKAANGKSILIELNEEGKVTYAVGKNKTTFDLKDCDEINYEPLGSNKKVVITEDMLSQTDSFEPWVWLVIHEGENRLEYNNNQKETRRHSSYSEQNDKWETLESEVDVLEQLLTSLEEDALREAIRALEPQQQELILDLYYRGVTMADVAKRDGVNKSSITKRVDRIIAQLKKSLKNY